MAGLLVALLLILAMTIVWLIVQLLIERFTPGMPLAAQSALQRTLTV